jgi:integrase
MPTQTLTDSFIRHHDTPAKRIEVYDDVVKGMAVRITKKGSKSFIYRYRINDRVRTYTIGSFSTYSLAEARAETRELKKKVGKGIDPMEEKKNRREKPKERTFADLSQAFKDYHMPGLRASTVEEYKRIIDVELDPVLGDIPADEVDMHHILSILDKKAFKDESPTMANRIRGRLNTIFEFGLSRDIVKVNPVARTKKYKQGENKRERFYSKDEIRTLWKTFNVINEPARSIYKILLLCGQRSRETREMHTDHLTLNFFDGSVWTIPKELSKSKRSHDVPLSPLALEVIEQSLEGSKTGNVFDAGKTTLGQSVKSAKVTIRKISGIEDFRAHDIRRTVATHMAKLGVDRTTLGKVLNHAGLSGDSQVTAIYDRHDYMKKKREALEKWARYLTEIVESKPGETTIHKIG